MGFLSLDRGAAECLPSSEHSLQSRSGLVFGGLTGTGRGLVLSKTRPAI